MEPRIQFCTSADGTRIGYGTRGERADPAVVYLKAWFQDEKAIWTGPYREPIKPLVRHRFWVSGDRRGVGASKADVDDIGLERQIEDLVAITAHADIEQFDLVGFWDGAAIAAAYAAEHPKRVLRLALMSPAANGEELVSRDAIQGVPDLIHSNWSLATRTFQELMQPGAPLEQRQRFASDLQRMASPTTAATYLDFASSFDVRPYLPRIQSPTLVHVQSYPRVVRASASREVAALIPGAEFGVQDDADQNILEIVVEFLDAERGGEHDEVAPSGTAVILFLDIADSTALTTRLGDATYREKERALDASLRSAITGAGGTPVEGKLLGDGVMAVFTSARQAIDAAKACQVAGGDAGMPLHIGIHAGDVVREGKNVHGGAVQLASRVQAEAAASEILVSQTVRDLARTSAGVAFEDRGEHKLKGVEEPQRLFAVRAERSPQETAD